MSTQDLDLDALERRKLHFAGDELCGYLTDWEKDALIQRLREAEAEYDSMTVATELAHARIRQLEARIAQLERVREYADHKGDCDLVWRPDRPADAACSCGLYATLAAVEASHAQP